MPRMVVIADDLTGAADCAASSAALGCRAVVLLHSPDPQQAWPDADIISIDANSRCLSADQASELTARLIRKCDSLNVACPGYVLYKKIDSTLRGNVAGELAALLHARRSLNPPNAKLSILMAPALPAQGRTTIGGRLLVHGVPLEQTDIWQTEARPAESDILQLLAKADLSCGLIDIHTVRSGLNGLRQAIAQCTKHNDVVVCDAETDDDLRVIAEAPLGQPTIAAFAGSSGLACQIPPVIGIAPHTDTPRRDFAAGPTLFVVGTAANVSRKQARMLEAIPGIATLHATPDLLLDSLKLNTQVVQNLQSGRDVLLIQDGGEHCSQYDGQFLPQALSDLASRSAQYLGGLVATGGDTARAALDALGIHRLRLLGEVRSGLPFSVADSWVRPLPVITKAGAFGSPQALIRCREFLQQLERIPARLCTKDPLLHPEG